MSDLLSKNFAGARVSMQRHSDARMFYGYVQHLNPHSVNVYAFPSVVLLSGDVFSFRIQGLGGDLIFNGTLKEWWAEERPHFVPYKGASIAVFEPGTRTYHFTLQGVMTEVGSSGDPRFLRHHGPVYLKNGTIKAAMRDISPKGICVLSDVPLEVGELVDFRTETPYGEAFGEARVKYIRQQTTATKISRIGMEIERLDRVNTLVWKVLMQRSSD